MLFKKLYLESLLQKGEIRNFSIAGKPTREMQEAFVKGKGFTHIFRKYGIESRENKFGSTLISVYFPRFYQNGRRSALIETCLINFDLKMVTPKTIEDGTELIVDENGVQADILKLENVIEEMNKVIEHLLVDVFDYYQVQLHPVEFLKILNIDDGYGKTLTFENMLDIIPEKNQSKLAESVAINRGTISDYKAGRGTPSLKIISKLMNLYPLLPWQKYISDIEKN